MRVEIEGRTTEVERYHEDNEFHDRYQLYKQTYMIWPIHFAGFYEYGATT